MVLFKVFFDPAQGRPPTAGILVKPPCVAWGLIGLRRTTRTPNYSMFSNTQGTTYQIKLRNFRSRISNAVVWILKKILSIINRTLTLFRRQLALLTRTVVIIVFKDERNPSPLLGRKEIQGKRELRAGAVFDFFTYLSILLFSFGRSILHLDVLKSQTPL